VGEFEIFVNNIHSFVNIQIESQVYTVLGFSTTGLVIQNIQNHQEKIFIEKNPGASHRPWLYRSRQSYI
jgi:hypothetical protein